VGRESVGFGRTGGDRAAVETPIASDVAVEFDDGFAACALMQAVDVLRDER